MKRYFLSAVIAAATLTTSAFAADVGVSVSIGQPGFYGQINIGDFPQPAVIYRQPIIINRGVSMNRPPVYLRVPPGHAKNWKKHCREYHACGERVLFVHDDWYEREYVPRYQEQHRDRGYDHQDRGRGDDHGNRGHGNNH
ncbi:MAG: hypothetical protein M0P91_11320 [Sulfuricurvum sp.]|jgi:hypothetical protein|uniref:hypothetical protein n=1 Tax=Sulfuricurvum sp. TaxID=2025608 RepID=UPI0025E5B986|nr:hypothetical protein [Sulfuricurvum sp.]MCK9373781.1 hypothetical protein [Sulfuricurvum sp.]